MAAISLAPDSLMASDSVASFQTFDTDGSTNDPPSAIEHDMSEEQLRELYDNEEIERFLHLFSAVRKLSLPLNCCTHVAQYVTEVRLPETPSDENLPRQPLQTRAPIDFETTENAGSLNLNSHLPASNDEYSDPTLRSFAENIAFVSFPAFAYSDNLDALLTAIYCTNPSTCST
jgi:hypothetical protein